MVQKVPFTSTSGNTMTIGTGTSRVIMGADSGNLKIQDSQSNTSVIEAGLGVVGTSAVSVVANPAALPFSPISSAGSMAFAQSTGALYISNGSGWYKVSLVNTAPSISLSSTTANPTATNLTLDFTYTVTEPEGTPTTVSIANSGIATTGNVAITHTTSNNHVRLVFDGTTEYAGDATVTLTVTDGVNTAAGTITITTSYYNKLNTRYNSLLLKTKTVNSTIPTAHKSLYFDGTGDYLTVSSHASMSLDADFTIEYWVYNPTSGNNWFFTLGDAKTATGFETYIGSSGSQFILYAGDSTRISSSTKPTVNAWSHVAVVRSSSTITLYLNGVSLGTWSSSATFSGNAYISAEYYNGAISSSGNNYLTDVRIVKGTAVYTSNFTPTTERLTAITNTSLLTCHLPYIADGSTNAHSIAVSGDTHTLPFSPYDALEYSNATHLGSVHFDGSGDYLHMPQTSLDLGSDDFCVEAWVYTYSTANQAIIGSYRYADGVGSWNLNVNYNSNKLRFFIRHSGGTVIDGQFESGTFPTNQWVHVAVTRDGANLRAFINGTQAGSTNTALASSSIDNAITTYRIGAANDNAIHWNGNIADVRVVKGSSVYTSNFTPTTAPLTAITNTIFLLQSTDAGIIDKAQRAQDLRLFGNTKSSTTQNKFLTSSMYFDGSGDYLKWTNTDAVDWGIGGEPFTLEWWQWWPSIVDSRSVGPQTGGTTAGWNGTSGHQWTMFTYSSSSTLFMQWWNGGGRTDYELNHGGALTASTWQHFAIVYDGTNLSNYVDGTRIGHRTSGNTFATVSNRFGVLGGNTAGTGQSEFYYSDVRITKGLARYSGTTLTVPTAALQG